ncbi:MAG TPA: ATP-binding protein [Solirubrobacterales bacterium]
MATRPKPRKGAGATGFTVDTQLFRELGELLVGRDSTALTELIKNAYDADATHVVVTGEGLRDADGSITVSDNGVGMTRAQFVNGFLRIAGRGKSEGERRSPRLERRYTGEKGIGRLAAHKLAGQLTLSSVAADLPALEGSRRLQARIDWGEVERAETLDKLSAGALDVGVASLKGRSPAGTTLELLELRRQWSDEDLETFVREVDSFEPPALLTEPLDGLVAEPLLFERPKIRDGDPDDRFEISLEGDFDVGEDLWLEVGKAMTWVVEMVGTPEEVLYRFAPANEANPDPDDLFEASLEVEDPEVQPSFKARVLVRETTRSTRRSRKFTDQVAGVRVYVEGFRVAGYGARGNDWLELDADYSRRTSGLRLDLPGLRSPLEARKKEGLRTLPNNSYLGAVFLTHGGAPDLKLLINREGFVSSPQYLALRDSVRAGLDLLTRFRAGRKLAKRSPRTTPVLLSTEERVQEGIEQAVERARAVRALAANASAGPVLEKTEELIGELEKLSRLADEMSEERSVLRSVAAVGTQMASFVHEIENIVATAATLEELLSHLGDVFPENAEELVAVQETMRDVRGRIERQASYLTDVTGVRSQRRRKRMKLGDRVEAAVRLLAPAADRLGIEIDNRVDGDLRTPLMLSAEITTAITNLVSNAVRAAGPDGKIAIAAGPSSDDPRAAAWLRIENTGREVDPGEGERWFRPFESTSVKDVDPLLGQGMGLGLPLTRSALAAYGATVAFVKPRRAQMKTALEVRFS